MNLPNKLTVLRICLIPVLIVILVVFPQETWANFAGCGIFLVASLTDLADGKIARKYGLVTDFGKFLDPLADKFMVIAALLCILYRMESGALHTAVFIAAMAVIFRELAVTSIRLVVSSSSGIVVAANMLGKIKTVSQIVCVMTLMIEPYLPVLKEYRILSWATVAFMTVMTVWSGCNYMKSYWKYLDPEK